MSVFVPCIQHWINFVEMKHLDKVYGSPDKVNFVRVRTHQQNYHEQHVSVT